MEKELRKRLVESYVRSVAFYGAEILTLRLNEQKWLEEFEMWTWRTEHVEPVISGDGWCLRFPNICLTFERKPRKNFN